MKSLRMELKVCEGCGALWVRSLAGGVYCNRCTWMLSDFPKPLSRKRRGRPKTVRELACLGVASQWAS